MHVKKKKQPSDEFSGLELVWKEQTDCLEDSGRRDIVVVVVVKEVGLLGVERCSSEYTRVGGLGGIVMTILIVSGVLGLAYA